MFNEYKNLPDFRQTLALIFLVKINRIIKLITPIVIYIVIFQ